jgi:hypothetical protein
MDNDINRLAARVQVAIAEELQTLVCPVCGEGFDVQFAAKSKKGKGVGSISVMCVQCMWRVVTDGIPTEPPWVKVLGTKTHTGAVPPAKKRAKPTVTA